MLWEDNFATWWECVMPPASSKSEPSNSGSYGAVILGRDLVGDTVAAMVASAFVTPSVVLLDSIKTQEHNHQQFVVHSHLTGQCAPWYLEGPQVGADIQLSAYGMRQSAPGRQERFEGFDDGLLNPRQCNNVWLIHTAYAARFSCSRLGVCQPAWEDHGNSDDGANTVTNRLHARASPRLGLLQQKQRRYSGGEIVSHPSRHHAGYYCEMCASSTNLWLWMSIE
ncbi:hypothetical protein FOVSG1_003355 [Fusarium oxysporum f. sp. vasinfectum]